MGKTSTKLAVYALVLLLFHLAGLAAAVSYRFYERADRCIGSSMSYQSVPAYYCCRAEFEAGSVGTRANSDQRTAYYGGGACCNMRSSYPGTICAYGGGYTGVAWAPVTSQSLLADDAEKACEAQMKPTGIAYSEESTKGDWILTTDNATEMYTQMGTIPYAQKVDWLKAHGATFESDL